LSGNLNMPLTNTKQPIIGIIGGAGPDATIDLQIELSKQMKIKLNAISDQDHYRVIVDNYTTMPDRSLSLSKNASSPIKHMQETALTLEKMGCNLLAYPCNTAHAFLPEIQKVLSIPLIDMLAETTNYIKLQPRINKIGILCTNMTRNLNLYKELQEGLEIATCYPEEDHQAQVMQAIFAVKAGYTTRPIKKLAHQTKITQYLQQESSLPYNIDSFKSSPKELFEAAAQSLVVQQGADAILLGCTEIPLCLTEFYTTQVINPTKILAAAIIDKATTF
jgi:aspartate racemase